MHSQEPYISSRNPYANPRRPFGVLFTPFSAISHAGQHFSAILWWVGVGLTDAAAFVAMAICTGTTMSANKPFNPDLYASLFESRTGGLYASLKPEL